MLIYEFGGPAVHAGLSHRGLPGAPAGSRRAGARRDDRPSRIHSTSARASSVLENTHNARGGRVWPLDELDDVARPLRRARSRRAPRRRAAAERGGRAAASDAATIGRPVRHGHALSLEGARLPARRAARRPGRADGARLAREVPLRRRHAPGRESPPRRVLRPRPPRRAARRRPRPGQARSREGSPKPALPVELDRVETNFVQIDVAAGSRRRRRSALLAEQASRCPRPPPVSARAVTHLDSATTISTARSSSIPRALGARVAPERDRDC